MGKYAPLGQFLRGQKLDEIRMTFAEIERVIGTPLPANAPKYPAWWSNNPSNNPMTKVWLDAGFRTEQVDIGGRKLVFRRRDKGAAEKTTVAPAQPPQPKGGPHPLFGALKGMIVIPEGVDLTEPAYPEWADLLDGKYGPERK